MMDNELV